jgi:hypothetical protein
MTGSDIQKLFGGGGIHWQHGDLVAFFYFFF